MEFLARFLALSMNFLWFLRRVFGGCFELLTYKYCHSLNSVDRRAFAARRLLNLLRRLNRHRFRYINATSHGKRRKTEGGDSAGFIYSCGCFSLRENLVSGQTQHCCAFLPGQTPHWCLLRGLLFAWTNTRRSIQAVFQHQTTCWSVLVQTLFWRDFTSSVAVLVHCRNFFLAGGRQATWRQEGHAFGAFLQRADLDLMPSPVLQPHPLLLVFLAISLVLTYTPCYVVTNLHDIWFWHILGWFSWFGTRVLQAWLIWNKSIHCTAVCRRVKPYPLHAIFCCLLLLINTLLLDRWAQRALCFATDPRMISLFPFPRLKKEEPDYQFFITIFARLLGSQPLLAGLRSFTASSFLLLPDVVWAIEPLSNTLRTHKLFAVPTLPDAAAEILNTMAGTFSPHRFLSLPGWRHQRHNTGALPPLAVDFSGKLGFTDAPDWYLPLLTPQTPAAYGMPLNSWAAFVFIPRDGYSFKQLGWSFCLLWTCCPGWALKPPKFYYYFWFLVLELVNFINPAVARYRPGLITLPAWTVRGIRLSTPQNWEKLFPPKLAQDPVLFEIAPTSPKQLCLLLKKRLSN